MLVPDSWIEVGRIGRPQGIKGEVTVEVRTDVPEVRFAVGAHLLRVGADPVIVDRHAWHHGRLLLTVRGVSDRTQAEALRDLVLYIDTDIDDYVDDDPDSFADRELVGLSAVLIDGIVIGTVTDVVHPPGSDLLEVTRADGVAVLVPFVHEFVPEVDLGNGRLVITPPEGLLEL